MNYPYGLCFTSAVSRVPYLMELSFSNKAVYGKVGVLVPIDLSMVKLASLVTLT